MFCLLFGFPQSYPLLFDEALKNMLTSHPQFAKLTAVNEAMKGIAAEVDKARDIANNTKILHALHNDVIDSRVRPLKFSDTDFIVRPIQTGHFFSNNLPRVTAC